MSYTHLIISERAKIETLLKQGYFANKLNRNLSTISRVLKRNASCTAEEAKMRYQTNKTNCGAKSI